MTQEGDAPVREVCSGMALSGGALEVGLSLSWSDFRNCGYSREGPM